MGPPRVLSFSIAAGSLAAKCLPLSIIGQPHDLKLYSRRLYELYNLRPRVPEDVWNEAVARVQDGGTIPLYLNKILLSSLLCRPTRYGCPFGSHDLHRIVKNDCSSTTKSGESILCILCEPPAILSYVAAIARAFPTFSRKTSPSSQNAQPQTPSRSQQGGTNSTSALHVEFLVLPPSRFCPAPGTDAASSGTSADTEWRSLADSEAAFCNDVANAVRLTQRLIDTPPDQMNVTHFLAECRNVYDEVASSVGAAKLSGLEDDTMPNNNQATLSFKVIRGEELVTKGFGGIHNVGRAAEDPPALAILTYHPSTVQAAAGALSGPAYTAAPIAFVGKGIVYDTGGLALKGRASMAGMKRDMGGAAGILGAFYLAVKRGFNQTLHAIFCLAENAIGPKALRVDDIITLYSGKSIEVTNPDAEGRLVLSDGIAYARQQLNCGTIVDMCTLTGAQSTATGKIHSAIMSNDQDLEHAALIAGRFSGDLTFPVLYAPELLLAEFSSAVADLKNSVSDRGVALVSCAGHFIEAASGLSPAENPPGGPILPRWLHIDMAAPVASGERATGYGVALLASLFGAYSSDPLLRVLAPPTTEQQMQQMANAALARQAAIASIGDVEMVAHTPEPSAAD